MPSVHFLIDYRPALDQVETLILELPEVWGEPMIAHMVLTQMCRMRKELVLVDVQDEEWRILVETIRGFVVC